MNETINKYKVDALVIAFGVLIGMVGANIVVTNGNKAVDFTRCKVYASDVEAMSGGKATLDFDYFNGCNLVPNL